MPRHPNPTSKTSRAAVCGNTTVPLNMVMARTRTLPIAEGKRRDPVLARSKSEGSLNFGHAWSWGLKGRDNRSTVAAQRREGRSALGIAHLNCTSEG